MSLIELAADGARAMVDADRGGRLASLRVDGRELLVGQPDATDRSIFWGSFLMAPWPGRLEAGRLEWAGDAYQLALTDGHHALHGVAFDRPWSIVHADARSAELEHAFEADAWPLGGRVTQRLALRPHGIVLEAVIVAERSMPAALGWHPWFLRSGSGPRLRVDAERVLETRALIPTGRVRPVAGPTDLRSGPAIGRRRLDHTYVDPRSPIELAWPELRLSVSFEAPVCAAVVHTRPDACCVEPQTAWPNALGPRLRDVAAAGLRRLAAGEALRARMAIEWETATGDRSDADR